MAAAELDGITIEYDEHGEGEPLLLVMGLGSQLIHWPDEFVADLAGRGFRVIRYDNRDSGLSTKIEGEPPSLGRALSAQISKRAARPEYLLSDMADDGIGLLEHLGIECAHVVGASMGGMIAQSIAIQRPDRVASLTSIMSNTGDRRNGRPSVNLLRKVARLLDPSPEKRVENSVATTRLVSGPHFDEAAERAFIERSFARNYCPDGTARQAMAISASPNRTAALQRLDVPTLVVHGLVDPLVMPSGGMATARAIAGSRLLMFPDMGHDLPRVRWDETIGAIAANARRGSRTAAAA